MIILGLTGSIGMGKSTTAKIFAAHGVAAYDADAAVHSIYRGAAAAFIEKAFPGTVIDGAVDRALLGKRVIGDKSALQRLEGIVHPLVRKQEELFIARAASSGVRVALLDIPLLFETGGDDRVHACVVVDAPDDIQRERVLARADMTAERFEAIRARQMSNAEKRRRAHFLIDTGRGLERASRDVDAVLRAVAAMV